MQALVVSSMSLTDLVTLQQTNEVYQFLSVVPISPETKFVSLRDVVELELFKTVIHFMHFALAAYGWPMLIKTQTVCGLCRIVPHLRSATFYRSSAFVITVLSHSVYCTDVAHTSLMASSGAASEQDREGLSEHCSLSGIAFDFCEHRNARPALQLH